MSADLNPITGNPRLTREAAETLSGPELAEALTNGDLPKALGQELFVVDRVLIDAGPSAGRANYAVRCHGWGQWWMPSLHRRAAEAIADARTVAAEYGLEIEVAEAVAGEIELEKGGDRGC